MELPELRPCPKCGAYPVMHDPVPVKGSDTQRTVLISCPNCSIYAAGHDRPGHGLVGLDRCAERQACSNWQIECDYWDWKQRKGEA